MSAPAAAPIDRGTRRVSVVFAVLLVLTVATIWFTGGSAHDLLSARGAASVAAVLAFVKARFVAMDFMELRGTRLQAAADAWFAVVGLVSLALLLR